MDTPAIKQCIKEIDPIIEETDEVFEAAVILLAILEVGTVIKTLHHFTGYGIMRVRKYMERWEANGIVEDGKLYHSGWDDEGHGIIAFWLDVMVGTGMIKKVNA